MLKRLLVTLLAIVLTIPVVGIQVNAEELSEEIQIQEVNEEVNNNEIITDDSYNVQVEEEIVEEVIEENQEEEVVIDNDAQVEVEQELEQEITTDEVIEEETTEEVKEVTTDVVDETLEEKQVEEEKLELQPAPMMMAAPKMAMLSLGRAKDPSAQEDTEPVYLKLTYEKTIQAKYANAAYFKFEGDHWVKVDNLVATNPVAQYKFKLDNSESLNNVYVEVHYNPIVAGTYAKFCDKKGNYDEQHSEYYAARRASSCVKAVQGNSSEPGWARYAMFGYGRQLNKYGTQIAKTCPEDDRGGVCCYSGYWAVTGEYADIDDINPNGGLYGTFTISFEISRKGFYNFCDGAGDD